MKSIVTELAAKAIAEASFVADKTPALVLFEKFAEHLLRECVDILELGMEHEDSSKGADYNAGELAGHRWARRAIKEKFGLK